MRQTRPQEKLSVLLKLHHTFLLRVFPRVLHLRDLAASGAELHRVLANFPVQHRCPANGCNHQLYHLYRLSFHAQGTFDPWVLHERYLIRVTTAGAQTEHGLLSC